MKLELCQKTVSLWSWMNRPQELERFLNPLYEANSLVIWPSVAPQSLLLWEGENTHLIPHAFHLFWHATYYILVLPGFCLFFSVFIFLFGFLFCFFLYNLPGSIRLLHNTDHINSTINNTSFCLTIPFWLKLVVYYLYIYRSTCFLYWKLNKVLCVHIMSIIAGARQGWFWVFL